MSDVSNPFDPANASVASGTNRYDEPLRQPPALDFGDLFNSSWEIMKENLGIIIGIVAVQIGIQVVFSVINQGIGMASQGLAESDQIEAALALQVVSLIVSIVGGIVNLWIGLGSIRAFYNIVTGREASIEMLFAEAPKLLPAIGIGFVVGIATALGLLFLIVPGIIVAIGLQFATYELVTQDADIGSALTNSWNMAWPEMLFLFGFGLVVFFGALLIGLVTCGLGFLVFAAYGPVLQANLYVALRHKYQQQLDLDMGVA